MSEDDQTLHREMKNREILDFMYEMARTASMEARDMKPGEVINSGEYGDNKRNIDHVAEDAITSYIDEHGEEQPFSFALKSEDSSWGEKSWYTNKGEVISGDQLDKVDIAFVNDNVEGTKNLQNSERYTTFSALDPENPILEGTEAALAYRWNDEVYFSDGENAYQTDSGIDDASEIKSNPINTIDNTLKLKGQATGFNTSDYGAIMRTWIEANDLEEPDHPSFKADGTTTSDILGTVNDRSLAIDLRALKKGAERLPYAHDFVAPARIAKDAGAEILEVKEDGGLSEVNIDYTEPGAATAYVAVPPGEVGEEFKQLIPEFVDRIDDSYR